MVTLQIIFRFIIYNNLNQSGINMTLLVKKYTPLEVV